MLSNTDALEKIANRIFSIPNNNTYSVRIKLMNYSDPDFVIDDVTINAYTLDQDFEDNCCDDFQMNISLNSDDVIDLVHKQNDLYATLTMEEIDQTSGKINLDVLPDIKEYLVLLHSTKDLLKQFNITALKNEDGNTSLARRNLRIDLGIQLINKLAYEVNKSSVMALPSNATVTQYLKLLTKSFGINKLKLYPPDNTVAFSRIMIPSDKTSFRDVFDQVQDKVGVYSYGLAYYLFDKTLHIYPAYELDPDFTKLLTLYKVSPNTGLGTFNTHCITEDEIEIIVNTETFQESLATKNTENEGNIFVLSSSDAQIDGRITIDKDGNCTNNDTDVCISSNVNSTLGYNSAAPKFKKSTMNIHKQLSHINANACELMMFNWSRSKLYAIQPSTKVSYVYDEENVLYSLTGIVNRVITSGNRVTIRGDIHIFSNTSSVGMRLDLEENRTKLSVL